MALPKHYGAAIDVDSREAYLFVSGDGQQYGVSLDREGRGLPLNTSWIFEQAFQLGVQEGVPVPIDPEPILRGLAARGYFTWPKQRMRPFGTSQ